MFLDSYIVFAALMYPSSPILLGSVWNGKDINKCSTPNQTDVDKVDQ